MRRVSHAARGVFTDMLSFCGDVPRSQTTGFLTTRQALDRATNSSRLVEELVANGNLEVVSGGYLIHDFEKYLPQSSTDRVRAWREKKRGETVTPPVTATPPKRLRNGFTHAREEPVPVVSVSDETLTPDPVPVSRIASKEAMSVVRSTKDAINEEPDDDGLRLAVLVGEFMGQNLKALEIEECRQWLKDFTYLGAESAMERIREYAAKRTEQGHEAIRSVIGYRRCLQSQNDWLADQGAPKVVGRPGGHVNGPAVQLGELLPKVPA